MAGDDVMLNLALAEWPGDSQAAHEARAARSRVVRLVRRYNAAVEARDASAIGSIYRVVGEGDERLVQLARNRRAH